MWPKGAVLGVWCRRWENHTIPAKICSPLVDVTIVTSPYVEQILTRNGAILIGERDHE
jgi:hypothetical protein